MATIKQIAALAGVSRGTVDRVLNNRGIVNPVTAANIQDIAQALHYTPNKLAKTLSIKKKKIKLGYIMINKGNGNPFFEDVTKGIAIKANELKEYGITVEIRQCDLLNANEQVRLMEELATLDVKGIAVTPINHPDVAAEIDSLYERGIPVVTVNTDIENSKRIAYVGSNYYKSGKTAAELIGLFTNGCCNVAIITGSMNLLCHSERISGFKHTIAKYCPDIRLITVNENHDDDTESFKVTKEVLTKYPQIDAIYLAAAGVGGACKAVTEMNLQKRLKIVSHDCIATTKKLVQDGIICATIGQQPLKQGSLPLDVLFEYLIMDKIPLQKSHYTSIEIKIRENM